MMARIRRPLGHAPSRLILLLSLVGLVLLVEQADLDCPWMWMALVLGALVYGSCVAEWTIRSRMTYMVTKTPPPVLPVLTGSNVPDDWVSVRCENCLRSGWVPPVTGAVITEGEHHFLCTDCAVLEGEVS